MCFKSPSGLSLHLNDYNRTNTSNTTMSTEMCSQLYNSSFILRLSRVITSSYPESSGTSHCVISMGGGGGEREGKFDKFVLFISFSKILLNLSHDLLLHCS